MNNCGSQMVNGLIRRQLGCWKRHLSSRRIGTGAYRDEYYRTVVAQGYQGVKEDIKIGREEMTNQYMHTNNEDRLEQLIDNFRSPIEFSFGYGLGVFEQSGYDIKKKPQIDMIHIVREPKRFHTSNLRQFAEHYSFLKMFGINSISKIGEYGAGVYFNPYVSMRDHDEQENMIKYGVISRKDALTDLSEWSSLYLAGRLQKPVKYLKEEGEEQMIQKLNQYNLKSAFGVALLMMKEDRINEVKLYERIAQLSYMGDIRMLIGGENPNKVKNIVSKQYKNFQTLYEPITQYFVDQGVIRVLSETQQTQDLDDKIRGFKLQLTSDKKMNIISQLPLQFRKKLYQSYEKKYSAELKRDSEAQRVLHQQSYDSVKPGIYVKSIANDEYFRKTLINTVKYTVAYPAVCQTLKGVFTAGLVKSFKYAWEKKVKNLTSN